MGNRDAAERIRARIGAAIFERVAGPQGRARRRQISQEARAGWDGGISQEARAGWDGGISQEARAG